MWSQDNEHIQDLMRRVITCCFTIKEIIQNLKAEFQNLCSSKEFRFFFSSRYKQV